jgi:hypothetical protein
MADETMLENRERSVQRRTLKKRHDYLAFGKTVIDLDAVKVETGINPDSGASWVRLTTHSTATPMSPNEARDLALNLLQAAEAALSDEMLYKLGIKMGKPEMGAQLVFAMRETRVEEKKQKN